MSENPYEAPSTEQSVKKQLPESKYATYDEVPTLRKQWVFWVTFVIFPPVALIILLSGDVYYRGKKRIRSFGIMNRVVAAVLIIPWSMKITQFYLDFFNQ